jgi:protein-disulfide isomerase
MGGACEKRTNRPADPGAISALDSTASTNGSVDTAPLAGVDVSKLDDAAAKVFYGLVGSLKSPCGKAHSLRTSYTSDTSCKRALFAVRYVAALLEDEAPEATVREQYHKKYENPGPPVKLDVAKAPYDGTANAPIRLVEFFDYECSHCQAFKPVMEKVLAERGASVSAFYMMYPLEHVHPNSRSAAQAALAANEQGKFKEMHDRLFSEQRHTRSDVMGFAKALGLDMPRFEQAYEAASAQVTSDLQQGEAAGVASTPTVFFNERKYEGPLHARYLVLWIDEELAVNR